MSVAAEKGRLDVVSALIAANADIEIKDQSEQTVLHSAAKEGNAALVIALVKIKADVKAQNKLGQTPLDLAGNDDCRFALNDGCWRLECIDGGC